MAFGILEPKGGEQVPGTVALDEIAMQSGFANRNMKLGRGKNATTILEPQPSEDPNDPLNWSQTKKYLTLLQVLLGTFFATNVPIPMLNSGLAEMAIELDRPVSDMTKLSGYVLLGAGAIGIFVSALARKYGKRSLYVSGSVFSLIGCIIGMCATDYKTLVAARIVQGLGTPAYDSLVFGTISDTFFVHERGVLVGLVLFLQSGITNGVSIVAGVIMSNLGWKYNFNILLPFIALQTISVFFFLPETSYRRKVPLTTEVVDTQDPEKSTVTPQPATDPEDQNITKSEAVHYEFSEGYGKKKTFWQEMSFFNGTFTDSSLLKMCLACPVVLTNVAASFSVFLSGFLISWYVGISLLSSILMSAPPYNLSAAGVGYLSAGPLIGCLLGSIFYAWISDPIIMALSRRNRGIYEPEFRIPVIILGVGPLISGIAAFGYCLSNGMSMYLLSFLWGFLLFGITIVTAAIASYAVDAFSKYAVEIFIMNILFKNFFFYGLSNFIVDWLVAQGPATVFYTMAGISAGLMLLAIPMYLFGKRYRGFWSRHDIIKKFGLETNDGVVWGH